MSDQRAVSAVYGKRRREQKWECRVPDCPRTGWDTRAPDCPDHKLPMVPAGTGG